MAEFNPYAPPEAEIVAGRDPAPDEGFGVWAEGDVLVMSRSAYLPHRCVKCNEPATFWVTRQLRWHPARYYLLLIFGLGPYWFALTMPRHKLRLAIPLCQLHRVARRRSFAIDWIVGIAGLAICFLLLIDPRLAPSILLGLAVMAGAVGRYALNDAILAAKRLDNTHAWLKKAGPAFLASLPPPTAPVVEI